MHVIGIKCCCHPMHLTLTGHRCTGQVPIISSVCRCCAAASTWHHHIRGWQAELCCQAVQKHGWTSYCHLGSQVSVISFRRSAKELPASPR